jgi:hypothetical protein
MLPFAELQLSVEDDWGESLATIGWWFLEDSGGQQWGGRLKEEWLVVPEEGPVSEWQQRKKLANLRHMFKPKPCINL